MAIGFDHSCGACGVYRPPLADGKAKVTCTSHHGCGNENVPSGVEKEYVAGVTPS
jgi:hypothetical protein